MDLHFSMFMLAVFLWMDERWKRLSVGNPVSNQGFGSGDDKKGKDVPLRA